MGKMDLIQIIKDSFEAYRSFNHAYPLPGSMATAAVIYPAADIASQYISDRRVDWRKVLYTTSLSPLYGIIAYSCIKSGDVVGAYISPHPFVKGALGPNLWGNLFNAFFFTNNTVGEKTHYGLGRLGEHYYKTLFGEGNLYTRIKEKIIASIPKKEYLNALIGTLTFWNAFQYVNYAHVPEELRTPSALGVNLFWVIGLSLWSLRGGRRIAAKTSL